MHRERLVRISSAVIAVLVAGACGSATESGHTSTATRSPIGKLALAPAPLTAAPSARNAEPAIFPGRPTKYVLDTRLADLGASAAVWRMRAHPVNATDVQRFATVLGLVGTPVQTSAGWEMQGTSAMLSFAVTDANATVSYAFGAPNAVGGSVGSVGSVGAPTSTTPTVAAPPAQPVDVPNAADATSMARGLLDRLGVLAGHEWSTVANDSGGVAVACPVGMPCPTVPPEVSARTVTFSLMLNGTRVDGVDWSITIGRHRRIESVNGEWAAPANIGSYPLRSTAAVFADLQHGTAKYAGPQPMMAVSGAPAVGAPTIVTTPPSGTLPTVAVHVTGVSLGLTRWDAYDNGHPFVDLVPTYRFHARIDGGASYDIEVLALEPGAVAFTNPLPTPKPLPAQPAPASPPTAR
jgi:hypothetical protein